MNILTYTNILLKDEKLLFKRCVLICWAHYMKMITEGTPLF